MGPGIDEDDDACTEAKGDEADDEGETAAPVFRNGPQDNAAQRRAD